MLIVINLHFTRRVLKYVNAMVVVIISMVHMQKFLFLMLLKNMSTKVFNSMSRTNETRKIKFCVCNNKQRCNLGMLEPLMQV